MSSGFKRSDMVFFTSSRGPKAPSVFYPYSMKEAMSSRKGKSKYTRKKKRK